MAKCKQLSLFSVPSCSLIILSKNLVTLCNCLGKGDLTVDEFERMCTSQLELYRKEALIGNA